MRAKSDIDPLLESLGWDPGRLRVGDPRAGALEGHYDLIVIDDPVLERVDLKALLASCSYLVLQTDADNPVLQGLPLLFSTAPRTPSENRSPTHVIRGALVPSWVPYHSPEDLLMPPKREPSLAELDLRILVGGSPFFKEFAQDYYDPDRIKFFGPQEPTDFLYSPDRETFADILAKLPDSWTPDLVVFMFPEYFFLPRGLETSPYPVVGLVSDWNVAFHRVAKVLGMFDLLLADAKGAQLFRAAGKHGVHYAPLYSFEPEFHKPAAGPPILDVSFLGNMNHTIQRSRAPHLWTVASLPAPYKVFIGTGLFGADYARIYQESRIVFNHSIRGELNLRCYEAPACGSLLFLERENLEARWLFREGRDCVYYGQDDLPSLLAYYIAHDRERELLARSGTERARASSYTAHFSGILTLLRHFLASAGVERPFAELPAAEQLRRLACVAFPSIAGDWSGFARSLLREAFRLDPQSGEIASDLAVVLCIGSEDETERQEGDARIHDAVRLLPDDPLVLLNYATHLMIQNDPACFEVLTTLWNSETPAVPRLTYQTIYSSFNVEMSRLCAQHSGNPQRLGMELSRLVKWQVATLLASSSAQEDNRKDWLTRAVALCPWMHETLTQLGEVCVLLGEHEEAIAHFKAAQAINPFDHGANIGLVNLYRHLGYVHEAKAQAELLDRVRDAAVAPRERMPTPSPLAIEGLREQNFSLEIERTDTGPPAWQAYFQSFLDRYTSSDDVALVIWSQELEPQELTRSVQDFLATLCQEDDTTPDILVLDQVLTGWTRMDLLSRVPAWNVTDG